MDKQAYIKNKIFDNHSLEKNLALWRFFGKKIVFTNGVFDLMHYGHIDYLSKAASLGDVLIVGMNTDTSVSKIKGPSRPINDEKSRLHVMASLFFVAGVILFDEITPINLITKIQPNVLVKGGDYTIEQIVGHEVVQAGGGEVVVIDFVPGYSTTALEKKIRDSNR